MERRTTEEASTPWWAPSRLVAKAYFRLVDFYSASGYSIREKETVETAEGSLDVVVPRYS